MAIIVDLYKKNKEVVNYLIFGVLTTIISLVTYYFLTYTFLNPNMMLDLQLANVISWIIGVAFAYVTNRKYVFESSNTDIFKEMGSFLGARVLTLIMDIIIMFIGVTILKRNDKIVKLISQVLVIVSNYIFSKIFVFKK